MEKNEYLDFDQTVQLLKTTPSTLYKWLQAGKIPGHKLGRQWRFSKDELETYISGKNSRTYVQRDLLNLSILLSDRSKHKEKKMNTLITSVSEKIIWDAFDHGSRLVHVYPAKGKYEIAYRSRSGLDKLTEIQEETFLEIDNSLKNLSTALDSENSRRIYLYRSEDDKLQVRYQKLDTVVGPRLTLQLYQPETDVMPIERIASDATVFDQFKSWAKKKSGLIIVTGAAGSGKTTTVYSLLNEYKNQGRLVFTIEDSVEMVIDGINQIELKANQNSDFDKIFAQVYSSDPDVICLGLGSYFGFEEKVFNAAYKAAASGHVVIVQMNKANCIDALATFEKYVQYPTADILIGISSQKLVATQGQVRAVYEFKE